MICQLLVDYKAMLLKHPFGQEDVPTDYSQNSQPVDAADTANTTYFIEDDNNYIARCMIEKNSSRLACCVFVCDYSEKMSV
jgi:hypothetical protein